MSMAFTLGLTTDGLWAIPTTQLMCADLCLTPGRVAKISASWACGIWGCAVWSHVPLPKREKTLLSSNWIRKCPRNSTKIIWITCKISWNGEGNYYQTFPPEHQNQEAEGRIPDSQDLYVESNNKKRLTKISPKPETSPTPIPWDGQRNTHTSALSVPNWRTSGGTWHPLLLFCKCACHASCRAAVESRSAPHSCSSGSEQMLSQERKKCFQDWKLKLIFIIVCSLGSSIMMESWRFSGSSNQGDLTLHFLPRWYRRSSQKLH